MKTYLINKFETVIRDIRAFLANGNPEAPGNQIPGKKPAVQNQPNKIQEPNRPRQNSPQKASVKKKSTARKDRSMLDSQGVQVFKGSGYKGKGNVDSSKQTHNRKRR